MLEENHPKLYNSEENETVEDQLFAFIGSSAFNKKKYDINVVTLERSSLHRKGRWCATRMKSGDESGLRYLQKF